MSVTWFDVNEIPLKILKYFLYNINKESNYPQHKAQSHINTARIEPETKNIFDFAECVFPWLDVKVIAKLFILHYV